MSSGKSAYLEAFWSRYFRLGFSILGAECAVSVAYFVLTSTGVTPIRGVRQPSPTGCLEKRGLYS